MNNEILTVQILPIVLAALVLVSGFALGQDIGAPDPEALKGLYPGKTYSPYAQRSFPSNVYWGDSHLHTSNSPDASLFGNTVSAEDAYRAARGEEVTSSSGLPYKKCILYAFQAFQDQKKARNCGPFQC